LPPVVAPTKKKEKERKAKKKIKNKKWKEEIKETRGPLPL
jgi:hypothetical protein